MYFFNIFIYLFIIYFWLRWVFISVRGLSLVVASGGHSSSLCAGLSLSRPLLLRSTGSKRAGSVVVAHGPSCSAACRDLPRPGLEPVSPALAGRLSTTAPPGKPLRRWILNHWTTREVPCWTLNYTDILSVISYEFSSYNLCIMTFLLSNSYTFGFLLLS